MRFFSTRFLSFGEVCFFSTRFLSFGEVCFFSLTRFLSFAGKLCYLRQPCCRMSTCSPRYRVRDNPLVLWTESISSKLLSIDTKMVLLPSIRFFRFRLLRSLGATQQCSLALAAVVPSYLVRQLGVALVEFLVWRHTKLTRSSRSLVNRLYDSNPCSDRISLSMGNPSALLFSLLYGAPANRLNRLQTLWCIIFFCCFFLLSNSAALCYRLWAFRIDR